MRKILWLLWLPLVAWAQLDDNTVTVTAARQLPALQPDQAVFTVYVTSPADALLDDVLAVLSGTGITAANLSGAEGAYAPDLAVTYWIFTLDVPLSKLGSTTGALLRSTIGTLSGGGTTAMQVTYSVSAQVSAELQASQQCPYGLLVADARAEAQKLAAAAGAALGPVLSLSDGSGTPTGAFLVLIPLGSLSASRVGDFLSIPSTPQSGSCTMTVQFGLTP